MIRRLMLPFFFLIAATAAQAEPAIRGVFVGVDRYEGVPALKGAVADARLIKDALRAAYQLDLDEPVPGQCISRNAISITLTDRCATRDAIYAALADQIEASAPGDTLVFYFAGHGSRIMDDERFDQASGYNVTLLPVDARLPGASQSMEILDRDLREVIDVANARGVNVVTIFDSCNSGTAVRGEAGEGQVRGIDLDPALRSAPHRFRLQPTGPGGGYRVHFGAAADDEEAREVSRGDSINGVFTKALARELVAAPDATFGDLATAVRLKVEQAGHKSQHPQAEGALRASLLGANSRIALYDAQPAQDLVIIEAGRLLGMTEGSTFALFASQSEALGKDSLPLATGTLTTLEDGLSGLKLDPVPASPLPMRLVAREIGHVFTGDKLRVSFDRCPDPAANEPLIEAMKQIAFAQLVEADQDASLSLMRRGCESQTDIYVFAKDATGLTGVGPFGHPAFAARLGEALLPIYNVRRLASLPLIGEEEAGIGICVTHQVDHVVGYCPEPDSTEGSLVKDRQAVLTVTNLSENARHIYVLVVDDRYAITQMIPANGGIDPPMAPTSAQKSQYFSFDTPGLYRFFVIASDAPIATAALEQPGIRRDYGRPCDPGSDSPELCSASGAGGARGQNAPRLGKWSISVRDVVVGYEQPNDRQPVAGPVSPETQARLNPPPDTGEAAALDMGTAAGADSGAQVPPELDLGSSRIVGGTEALAATARWQAEIFTTYKYTDRDTEEDNAKSASERYFLAQKDNWEKIHRCGAVYIGDRFVLTAAHCVRGINDFGKTRRVRLGTQDLTDPGVHFQVSEWQAHRGFVNAEPYPHDIALLLIKADNLAAYRVDLDRFTIRLLGTMAGDRKITPLDRLRVTGWGRTKARNEGQGEIARDGTRNRMSAKLLQIDQRMNNQACASRDGYRDIIPGKAICAVATGQGQDSCNGDSGGPMTVARPDGRLLVGLVSWGRGCALRGMPAVYTDVSGYLTWIDETKQVLLDREKAKQGGPADQ